jgi:hypothetical protein
MPRCARRLGDRRPIAYDDVVRAAELTDDDIRVADRDFRRLLGAAD